ncbi:MAG: hypothetical protein AAGG75_12805 [Bacteroidota bacterium]
MRTKLFSLKNILIAVLLLILDFGIYIFLGLVILNYEDFYEESEGPYFSLKSMTLGEQAAYIGFHIWIVINIAALGYLLFRIVKYLMTRNS